MAKKITAARRRELLTLVREGCVRLGNPTAEMKSRAAASRADYHWGLFNESRGTTECQHCGHSWHSPENASKVSWWRLGDPKKMVACPKCGSLLSLGINRRHTDAWYFAALQNVGDAGVLRVLYCKADYSRPRISGKPVYMSATMVAEIAQVWYFRNGDFVTVMKPTTVSGFESTPDLYDFSAAKVGTMNTYLKSIDISEWQVFGDESESFFTKRGLSADTHGYSLFRLMHNLMTDNKFETLWKLGAYSILDYDGYKELTEKYWKQCIALAGSGKEYNIRTWHDFLKGLEQLGKDIHNKAVYLPDDLVAAENSVNTKLTSMRRRARALEELERYLKTDEPAFQKLKGKYFPIVLKDDTYTVSTLSSIQQYFDDADSLCHCVFHNHYWDKKDTLVLRVVRNSAPEKTYANVELSLTTGEVLQNYAACNEVPEGDEQIRSLVTSNFKKYRNARKTAPAPEPAAPVFGTA